MELFRSQRCQKPTTKAKIKKEKPLSTLDPAMPAMYCAITKKERVNNQVTSTEGGAAPAARKGDGGQKEMTGNEYQRLAARTINKSLTRGERESHALHGLAAEIGELHGLYQKAYQGHSLEEEHAKKEVGDILWMIAGATISITSLQK